MSSDNGPHAKPRELIRNLLGRPRANVLIFDPDDESRVVGQPRDYSLTIDLTDGSWLVFKTSKRTWGLNNNQRLLLVALFALISSLGVANFAGRRLARPVERFSRAAERFGTDVHAPPIDVEGPIEFRRAIAAFNDMQAKVQRFVSDRTEMLAAISHDLRAPLTRMRLQVEFIDDGEQQRKLFRDVDEMQAMVNSALSFFRDDSVDEVMTRFDISVLINTVIDDFRDAGKPISFDGPSHMVYFGRPLALRRAIANVVDNAIKYGYTASVRLTATTDYLEICVDDLGPGIPEALQETVFRPFFRVEPSRNRQTGGVGIGLSASRSTVRGHGGDIELSNGKFQGLSARIILPFGKVIDLNTTAS